MKKPTLSQQQNELRELIDERLSNEDQGTRQRVDQWLLDNQYFVDNELFDFYFCVAQNLAAVEVLGGSGEKIVKAKMELEESVETYTKQVVDTYNWIHEQLDSQLRSVLENQQKLDMKLIQVLEGLTQENRNLKTISTGLVNSTSVLLKKQKQLLVQTQFAHELVGQSVIIAWIIPVVTLLGCMAVLLLNHKL